MNKWKIILITLGVVAAVAYVVFAFVFSSQKEKEKPTKTDISINIKDYDELQFIGAETVKKILKKNGIRTENVEIADEDLGKIESILEKEAVIKNVDAYKTVSGKVKIDVSQREPVFRVMGKENYYLDKDTMKIPVSGDFTAFVPIVTGYADRDFVRTKAFYDFINFLEDNTFWQSQFTQINIDRNKEITLIPRVGRHTILLGTLDNYEQKMEKLRKFYERVLSEKGWNKYSKINLQFEIKNQIICTKIKP